MRQFTPFALLLAASLAADVGCAKDEGQSSDSGKVAAGSTGQRTLYERLGGEDAIRQIVRDFVQRSANNPQVNFERRGHPHEWDPSPKNVKRLEDRFVQYFAQAAGGPQVYKGDDMVRAHAGMRITAREYDAFAADVRATLQAFKVGEQEQAELLEIVGEIMPEIINK